MTYPTSIPDWLIAARDYLPPADVMESYYTAVYQASPVLCIVDAFTMLRNIEDLDQNGLKVLLGAADLIRKPGHEYHGLSVEAATLFGQRIDELEIESPEEEFVEDIEQEA